MYQHNITAYGKTSEEVQLKAEAKLPSVNPTFYSSMGSVKITQSGENLFRADIGFNVRQKPFTHKKSLPWFSVFLGCLVIFSILLEFIQEKPEKVEKKKPVVKKIAQYKISSFYTLNGIVRRIYFTVTGANAQAIYRYASKTCEKVMEEKNLELPYGVDMLALDLLDGKPDRKMDVKILRKFIDLDKETQLGHVRYFCNKKAIVKQFYRELWLIDKGS